ncbi:hypothetical protein MLD38_029797 [Melastoma candidum]|uniref:Uncharacterized protein n=1 Tax=Melastoma candidum TaxID=119954 RepID=A0ACB9NAE4_9MYRT|nr:hypothetical protein MLD38_029797 [Melastoma candidum]
MSSRYWKRRKGPEITTEDIVTAMAIPTVVARSWDGNHLDRRVLVQGKAMPFARLRREIAICAASFSRPDSSQSPKGVMYFRVGLLVLLVSSSSWIADAGHDLSLNGDALKNENTCTLCEEFTRDTLRYFRSTKTQTMILNVLHKSCAQALSLKKQCITLVDHYAHVFFKKLSSVKPRDFCQKVDFCHKKPRLSLQVKEEKCDLCHQVVSRMFEKVKNPDTQILLKACNSMEGHAKKCKRIVFEYGPLILANAELFLETGDVCMTMHACGSSKAEKHIGLETSSGHSSS